MIANGDIVRTQFIWHLDELAGRSRFARCVVHYRAHSQTGASVSLAKWAEDLAGLTSPLAFAFLSDDVGFVGCQSDVVFPLLSGPGVYSLPPLPNIAWGPSWLQQWGARLLLNTDSPRRRYDPWIVVPFVPTSQLDDISLPSINSTYASAVESLLPLFTADIISVGATISDTILMRACSWARSTETSRDIVSGSCSTQLRCIRRRNVFWRDLSWP